MDDAHGKCKGVYSRTRNLDSLTPALEDVYSALLSISHRALNVVRYLLAESVICLPPNFELGSCGSLYKDQC